jgi:dynein light intermediate chain
VQSVSREPAETADTVALTKELDKRLTERQARDNGICPVREELFSQCFDEILRQVTLRSPDAGWLLHRVRDDFRLTISAYQMLYKR